MLFEKMPVLPDDLAAMDEKQLNTLCEDIRKRLVETVSVNGGHLASNLGVVELTVALYSIYNPHRDRIIWDVGHQSYVHKILTGRDAGMDRLRRPDAHLGRGAHQRRPFESGLRAQKAKDAKRQRAPRHVGGGAGFAAIRSINSFSPI